MIEFPRSLARHFWAVLRRAVPKPHGPRSPLVEFRASGQGLRVRVAHPEVAVEYQHAGSFASASLTVPLTALAAVEGKSQETVTLEAGGDGKVLARWLDAGVPQVVEYEVGDADHQAAFPDPPERFVRNPAGLLVALDEAGQSAATDSARYALHRLLLRGRTGEVIATDGKQLLLQGGFQFPWDGDVLVPRVPAFGGRDFGQAVAVEVGKTEQHVVLRVGSWTFYLHVDADARCPKVEQVIPKANAGATHWRIATEDAAFLARALPRLPGDDEDNKPLTVDLNGQVCLRARGDGQSRVTEVVLARSAFTGPPVRFCLNRLFLARILRLGFDEVQVQTADLPLLCQDNERTLVVMPLPKDNALAPTDDVLRIASAVEEPSHSTPMPERKKPVMPVPSRNGNGSGMSHPQTVVPASEKDSPSFGNLVAEAEALKDTLHDAYGRANRLVAALRRHRKQTKLVASTLASLKQLQQIGS